MLFCYPGCVHVFLLLVCICVCLDNCKRVAVCFDDVISSVEVINSQSIQVQVRVIISHTGHCTLKGQS